MYGTGGAYDDNSSVELCAGKFMYPMIVEDLLFNFLMLITISRANPASSQFLQMAGLGCTEIYKIPGQR